MDISNLQGLGAGITPSADNDGLSLFKATAPSSTQKTFADQFKAAAQAPEAEPSDLDQDVVSERISTEEIASAQNNAKSDQQNIKTTEAPQNINLPDLEGEVAESISQPTSDNKNVNKHAQDLRAAVQEQAKATDGGIVIDEAAIAAQAQRHAKAIKTSSAGVDDSDEVKSGDGVDEANGTEEAAGLGEPSPAGDSGAIAQQQKLFSLNLRSSLKFLKDQKSFAQRFTPEIIAYDEDTGYVNGPETLEMLGWQDIHNVKETYFSSLTNERLNTISNTQDVLRQANEDGLTVYEGHHPVFAVSNRVIALEQLTGELTIINSLNDLRKLQLDDDVIHVHQMAE